MSVTKEITRDENGEHGTPKKPTFWIVDCVKADTLKVNLSNTVAYYGQALNQFLFHNIPRRKHTAGPG